MMKSINRFYFFRQFNAGESSLCQIGSWNQKQIFKVKILSPQFHTLSMLNSFVCVCARVNTTEILNLTTAPTCSSQNHVAMTIHYIPLSFHLDFFFLPILGRPSSPSGQSLLQWSAASPSQLLLIVSSQSSLHLCSRSSIVSFSCSISDPVGKK